MEEEGCHSHDDATPLSFWLQVTEDFLKIFLHVLCNFSHIFKVIYLSFFWMMEF